MTWCSARLWLGCALLLVATVGEAHADKVGVAAAVNPDAFSSLSGSPKTQLNIGKSIFFNERINTTGSGLVQVLLIDGSTFTVGPGSDLVIDKFVYNPNKKTGEVVATFTKGAMRFVGGKISKNPEGVTVNTPAGVLAIRGGMFMTNGKIFAFLFGETMTLTGKNGQSLTVFAPGNLIDATNGEIRETKPGDIAMLMAALSPGGNGGVNPGPTPPPPGNGVKAATLSNIAAEIITEATATQIQDAINQQIANLNVASTEAKDSNSPDEPTTTPTEPTGPTTTVTEPTTTPTEPTTPPTDTTPPPPPQDVLALGYAAGAFEQTRGYADDQASFNRPGTMLTYSPTDVALQFDGTTNAFKGAVFNLFASDDGGTKITFVPLDISTLPISDDLKQQLKDSGIFLGTAATSTENPNSSIVAYGHTLQGDPPQFDNTSVETINDGAATLIGFTGNGQVFCDKCDFIKWGAWLTALNVQNNNEGPSSRQIDAFGFWVAGDSIPTVGQLPPTLGTATYDGRAIGQILYGNDGIRTYIATGDVHMDWDFQHRTGVLDITQFGVSGNDNVPVLNSVKNRMDMPGVATALNKFSGQLLGTLDCDCNNSSISGLANGSFVANGNDKAAGVIGNFSVATSGQTPYYQASGVFGAGRDAVTSSGTLPNLPVGGVPAGGMFASHGN